ncbi:MAG: hypothetical protein Q9227_004709 [Pyrenula ochraceoflavens]
MATENLHLLKYNVLRQEPVEFRLIKLLPDIGDGYIHCSLETHPLDQAPEYTALSYCWGSTQEKETLIVNGSRLQITPNLAKALRHLYSYYRCLFVDAICINQSDTDERTRLVRLMKSIYSNAHAVAAWLGPSDKIAERAIDAITAHNGFNLYQYDAAAVGQFFCRPFWKRVWIIQEIAVARTVSLHCGNRTFPWESLEPILSYSNYLSSPSHRPLVDIVNLRHKISSGESIKLFSALFNSSAALATDIRDKVFALLGLVDEGTDLEGLLDYSLSVSRISAKLTQIFLQATGDVDWIFFGKYGERCLGSNVDTPASLPSWAFSWLDESGDSQRTTDRVRQVERHLFDGKSSRLGSNSLLAPKQLDWLKVIDDWVIQLQGHFVDIVESVGHSTPHLDVSILASGPEFYYKSSPNISIVSEVYIASPFTQPNSEAYVAKAESQNVESSFRTVCTWVRGTGLLPKRAIPENRHFGRIPLTFQARAEISEEERRISESLRMIQTSQGLFGWAHQNAREEDHIYLLSGSRNPMILRPVPFGDDTFTVVGDAWMLWPETPELFKSCPWLSEHQSLHKVRLV